MRVEGNYPHRTLKQSNFGGIRCLSGVPRLRFAILAKTFHDVNTFKCICFYVKIGYF